MSWDFNFGTNIQHALLLARKMLCRQPGTRQVMMITDGEPTAHLLPDGEPFFSYPPSPATLRATLAEVARCTAENIRINTFMLDATPDLQAFVERMARMNRGRVFFTTPENLGSYVLVDFLEQKRSLAATAAGHRLIRRTGDTQRPPGPCVAPAHQANESGPDVGAPPDQGNDARPDVLHDDIACDGRMSLPKDDELVDRQRQRRRTKVKAGSVADGESRARGAFEQRKDIVHLHQESRRRLGQPRACSRPRRLRCRTTVAPWRYSTKRALPESGCRVLSFLRVEDVLIELDDRRRASFGKLGRPSTGVISPWNTPTARSSSRRPS